MSRPPARPSERRERGLAAEGLAASFLEERGWEIVARNHHARRGEVDLIASKGETLAFVEVRSRSATSLIHPLESLTFQKRRRIIAAAIDYAQRNRLLESRALRFDVISILDRGEGEEEIEWIEGAFDGSGA